MHYFPKKRFSGLLKSLPTDIISINEPLRFTYRFWNRHKTFCPTWIPNRTADSSRDTSDATRRASWPFSVLPSACRSRRSPNRRPIHREKKRYNVASGRSLDFQRLEGDTKRATPIEKPRKDFVGRLLPRENISKRHYSIVVVAQIVSGGCSSPRFRVTLAHPHRNNHKW